MPQKTALKISKKNPIKKALEQALKSSLKTLQFQLNPNFIVNPQRLFLLLFFSTLITSCVSQKVSLQQRPPDLRVLKKSAPLVSPTITSSPSVPFVKHEEKGPLKSYLAMNLAFSEYAELRALLEQELQMNLANRGEAHITVITPVEFDRVLGKKITIEQINELAEKMNIQKSPFRKICIGEGTASIKNHQESTYFVVVESESLMQIRNAIQALYVAHGGLPEDFLPGTFYPHITLGYTQRDLHLEDGLIKNARSCRYAMPAGADE